MKHIFSILVFLISCAALYGQQYRVTVRDESGEALPYVHAVVKPSGVYILSDASGVLIFDNDDFTDRDTLIFDSMFYEKREVFAAELKKSKEIILKSRAFALAAVTVTPEDVEKMVSELAAFFSAKYARDYAARVTQLSTVECNGKYREFYGCQGILASCDFTQYPYPTDPWDDPNWQGRLAPLSVMRSDPLMPGSDDLLEQPSITAGDNIWSKAAMAIEYEDYPYRPTGPIVLTAKRSIEIYTPLNPRQVKNYAYAIDSVYMRGNDQIYVIRFKTKPLAYPKHTKVFGRGYVYYNRSSGLAEKVVMENHQDQFSLSAVFPGWRRVGELLPSATQHRIEVQYALQDGSVYTKSVALTVNWLDPRVDENFYRFKMQSRRNPVRNRLREYDYYAFSDVVLLNSRTEKQVRQLIHLRPYLIDHNVYTAPFEEDKWESLPMPGIDAPKLFRDLHANGKTLYEQARTNGLCDPYKGKMPADYYLRTRNELYPLLYGQKYE